MAVGINKKLTGLIEDKLEETIMIIFEGFIPKTYSYLRDYYKKSKKNKKVYHKTTI